MLKADNLHVALTPISWLNGKWATESGNGKYPTITPFKYHETVEFSCVGQPMFNFMSISKHPEKNTPMHQERGFLRIKPGTNILSFVVSHNFGLTTVEEGICNIENKEIELQSTNIARTSFSKSPHVTSLKRFIKLISDNTMEIVISMETDNTPLTEHLHTVYKRVP